MTDPKKTPGDRKSAAAKKPTQREAEQAIAAFMTTGIDLTPFTVDLGDGVEWAFKSDLSAADLEGLISALRSVNESRNAEPGSGEMTRAAERLDDVLRGLLVDEEQRANFPLPTYGMKVSMFLATRVTQGRTGFPTE